MIKRIAKTMKEAQANAPYYVMPKFKDKYCVYQMMPVGCVDMCILSMVGQEKAENECERLNNEWVARKIVECMKEPTDEQLTKADYLMFRDKCKDIWQRMIDTVLV